MVATPPQTDIYGTALDIFDRTHPLRVDVDENLKVTLAGAVIPISGTVDQGTAGTDPWPVKIDQTGTNSVVHEENVDKNFGTWAYYAGDNGTVVVADGQRVLGIACHAATAGSFTINGGDSIFIPPGVSVNISPLANLVAPTIVFVSTDSYFIEVVS